ncbi:MAG: aminotransferase class I/II-fold pyridoxal phosphate-dependent enzyme [Flavobacteriaceae bacterium]|nr:aminotransferase class I/II-fold pyridoxal phosphate-dependent enzyme [Flavobacteriaceae bacterium]
METAKLHQTEKSKTSTQSIEIKLNNKSLINFFNPDYFEFSSHSERVNPVWDTENSTLSLQVGKIYQKLEEKISGFLRMEDTLLYSNSFDSNGGIFESLLTEKDAVICDELSYNSVTEGIRLNKAVHYQYRNNNIKDLEYQLQYACSQDYRFKIIVTDGVFSLDGSVANLSEICNLAEKYKAWVVVDDSHALGFMGETGRGTPECCHVLDKIDIVAVSFGESKGGFVSGKKEIINVLRKNPRSYLSVNSSTLKRAEATSKIFDTFTETPNYGKKVLKNADYFRKKMKSAGFDLVGEDTAIMSVMLYDAQLAQDFADKLRNDGIYALGFSCPVVPAGKARIRIQISALHTQEQLDEAAHVFAKIGKEFGVI